MIRVVLFLTSVALIAFGFAWLADRPGQVAITWLGYRLDTSVMVGAIPQIYGWKGGAVSLATYFAMARGAQGETHDETCGHTHHGNGAANGEAVHERNSSACAGSGLQSGGLVADDYLMSSHPLRKVPKPRATSHENLLRWLSTGGDSVRAGKLRGLVDQSVEQLCWNRRPPPPQGTLAAAVCRAPRRLRL